MATSDVVADSISAFLASGRPLLPPETRCKHFTPIHSYDGLTMYFHPESALFHSALDFQWRPSDVVVSSGPKAGTTWTQEMVWLIANDFDYEAAKKDRLDVRFPYMEFGSGSKDDGLGETAVQRLDKLPQHQTRFIKTHLPLQLLHRRSSSSSAASSSSSFKMIYVTRNPKDVVVSYYNFLSKSLNLVEGTFEQFAKDFMEDKLEYSPYVETVVGYWERAKTDENLLFITYEQLKEDFIGVSRKVAEFLGKKVSDEQLDELKKHCSFNSMKNNDMVNFKAAGFTNIEFMRKGIVGDFKNYFNKELEAEFDKYVEERLVGTDFNFAYN